VCVIKLTSIRSVDASGAGNLNNFWVRSMLSFSTISIRGLNCVNVIVMLVVIFDEVMNIFFSLTNPQTLYALCSQQHKEKLILLF